jgi:uncharacterized membrane protein YbaN (DUF454 family)
MRPKIKRILVLIVGWMFILVGIAGLFLPILQGILCIVIGLIILSSEYVWAHRLLQRLKNKFPKIAQVSEKAAYRAERWLHPFTRKENSATEKQNEHRAEKAGRNG